MDAFCQFSKMFWLCASNVWRSFYDALVDRMGTVSIEFNQKKNQVEELLHRRTILPHFPLFIGRYRLRNLLSKPTSPFTWIWRIVCWIIENISCIPCQRREPGLVNIDDSQNDLSRLSDDGLAVEIRWAHLVFLAFAYTLSAQRSIVLEASWSVKQLCAASTEATLKYQ